MENHDMNVDFDLLFLDFEDAFAQAPERAVHALQAILLDPAACRARITFLRSLEDLRREGPGPAGRRPDQPQGEFAREIRTILEIGILPALEQGRLEPGRLAALTRDADALRQLHHALTADDTEDDTEAVPAPSGFTALAARGAWEELGARLRPHLPYLLMHVGLPAAMADPLHEFLVRRARGAGTGARRFRELVPGWLDEFARESGLDVRLRPLREEDWVRIIEWSTVQLVLEEHPAGEPAWARSFRRAARDRGVASRRELAAVALPADPAYTDDDLASFRRHLTVHILEQTDRARLDFELN
jgi:hypothetical protein